MGMKFGQMSKRYEANLFPKESTPPKKQLLEKSSSLFF